MTVTQYMNSLFKSINPEKDLVPSIDLAVKILEQYHDAAMCSLKLDLKQDIDLSIPLSSLVPLEQKAKYQLIDAVTLVAQSGIPHSRKSPIFQSSRLLGELTVFNLLLRDAWAIQKKRKTYAPLHPMTDFQNKLIVVDYEKIDYGNMGSIVSSSWDMLHQLAQASSYKVFYRAATKYAAWLSDAVPISFAEPRGFDMAFRLFVHSLLSNMRLLIVEFGRLCPSELCYALPLPSFYNTLFQAFKTVRDESLVYESILKHMNDYWIEDLFHMVVCINFIVSYRRIYLIKNPRNHATRSLKMSKLSSHDMLMQELGRYTKTLLDRLDTLFYFKPIIVDLSHLIVDFGFHQACYASGSLYHCLICLDEFEAPQVCTQICKRESPCKEAVLCKPCHKMYTSSNHVVCPICRT